MGAASQPPPPGVGAGGVELIDGRYRVDAALGEGAMGTVFRVRDVASGADLALKRLRLDPEHPERIAHAMLRFRREFHTMAQFRHPRIVRVFDFGQDAEGAYYTMELLEGADLGDLAPLPIDRACRMLRDVASALAFLHGRRLLHRDVAARNVRVADDGTARLIDFGVLATFGVAGEVAGTPTCVPPEAMRGLPLDHRADLYGLGALAYYVLTGGHAYPAHSVYELEAMWAKRPAPPSAYRDDVPPELDALVMSLLSVDPMRRPASAAEAIDRLSGAAGLEAEPETETATGWLQSAALVGRQREMEAIRKRVAGSVAGSGGALLLEAPSGMGKSRLLREAGLEAQLGGATVLHARAEEVGRGPYAVLRALLHDAHRVCPDDAREAARAHAGTLARLVPELLDAPEAPAATQDEPADPAQERVEEQRHLLGWLADLADRRPLVLLLDDVQRADEASAAVLAALTHAAGDMRLGLLIGLRTDEPVRAPGPIAAVRDGAHRLRVRGLSRAEVEQLVRGFFGDVPHADVVARTMRHVAGGGPLHCTELARHLVDRGVIRYDGGAWLLPPRIDASEAPKGLAEALDARVAALSPAARALGEALAVQGGDVPLELCVRLADDPDESAVFAALDALVQDEILIGTGDSYGFRHDGLREALLRGVEPDRLGRLHLRAGEALAGAHDVTAEREAQVGWHFERGGDPDRAAQYLERAGRRLYDAHSFSDAIAPLEAALRMRQARGDDPVRCMELRQMLVRGGVLCDRSVVLRYAGDAIADMARASGLRTATRLAPRLGRLLALGVGLGGAWLRWLVRPAAKRGPHPVDALTTLITMVNYAASAHSLSFDLDALRPLVRLLEPLSVLRGRLPHGAYLMTENFHNMAVGRYRRVRDNVATMLRLLETDRLTPLSDIDRRMGQGAALYMRASAAATTQDPSYEDDLMALESLDLRFFEAASRMDRLFYHRLRGEESEAERLQQEAEVMFVQLGNVWVFESQLQWISALAYGLTRDVVGLKRCVEGIERLVREGYRLEPFAALARGEYLRERGDAVASRRVLEALLGELPEVQTFVRQHACAALAETHLALDEVADALRVAASGFALGSDPELGQLPVRLRCGRALALAEAADGRPTEAATRLDALLAEAADLASPALSGSLHEARARVALQTDDRRAFAEHFARADRWFRFTRNPALVARMERLEKTQKDRDASGRPVRAVTADAVTAFEIALPQVRVATALQSARGPSERAVRALELLLAESAAARGFLFAVDGEALELLAPSDVGAPEDLRSELERLCSTARRGTARSESHTIASHRPDAGAWLPVVLAVEDGGRTVVVGAAALVGGSLPLRMPEPELIRELSAALRPSPRELAAS